MTTAAERLDDVFFGGHPRVLEIDFQFKNAAVMLLAKVTLERHNGFEMKCLDWFDAAGSDTRWAVARVRTIMGSEELCGLLWDILDPQEESESTFSKSVWSIRRRPPRRCWRRCPRPPPMPRSAWASPVGPPTPRCAHCMRVV